MKVRSLEDDLKMFVNDCKSHNYVGLMSMMKTRNVNPWKVIVATAILDTYRSEMRHDFDCMSYWTKRIKGEISLPEDNINRPVGHKDFYLAYEFASNAKLGNFGALNDCLVASTIKDYVNSNKQLFDAIPYENMVRFPASDRNNMNNVLFDLNITDESLKSLSNEMELHFSLLEDCIELYMNPDINPESAPNEDGELEIGELWRDGNISAVLDCIKQSLITQKEGLSTIIKIARKSSIFESITYHAEICFSILLKSGKDDLRTDNSNSFDVSLSGMIK